MIKFLNKYIVYLLIIISIGFIGMSFKYFYAGDNFSKRLVNLSEFDYRVYCKGDKNNLDIKILLDNTITYSAKEDLIKNIKEEIKDDIKEFKITFISDIKLLDYTQKEFYINGLEGIYYTNFNNYRDLFITYKPSLNISNQDKIIDDYYKVDLISDEDNILLLDIELDKSLKIGEEISLLHLIVNNVFDNREDKEGIKDIIIKSDDKLVSLKNKLFFAQMKELFKNER